MHLTHYNILVRLKNLSKMNTSLDTNIPILPFSLLPSPSLFNRNKLTLTFMLTHSGLTDQRNHLGEMGRGLWWLEKLVEATCGKQ